MTASVRASIVLESAEAGRAGADRLRLLQAVDQAGSITGAARRLGVSFRSAWDGVQCLNGLFGTPMVVASQGGAGGGGRAALTPAGRRLQAELAALEGELETLLSRMGSLAAGSGPAQPAARDRWEATVVAAGADELSLVSAKGAPIVSSSGPFDARARPGAAAAVLIKPASVLLTDRAGVRTSARNAWAAEVEERRDGGSGSLIRLELETGDRLDAVVTRDSADRLELVPGAPVCALVKASHVLVTFPASG